MMSLLPYHVTVESFFSDVVDVLRFSLVERHHEFADFVGRRYVTSFKDLERTPLADRISFLTMHGWEEAKVAADRELRNAAAHRNHRIEDDGVIVLERQKISIDIDDFKARSEALRTLVCGFGLH